MHSKGNSKSIKTVFKALSPSSATSKQLKTIQRPSFDYFTHNSRLPSPYLSRDDIQVRENSKSPTMISKKTKKNQRKRKIWTLPTKTWLPPAGSHCPEGFEHCNTYLRPKDSAKLRTAIGDRPSDSEREKYGMYKRSVINQCPIKNTSIRDISLDSERETYAITRFRTDRTVTEFNTATIQKSDDSKDVLVTAKESLSQSPTYIIPRTLTPERQLNSQDILKLFSELNNTRVNKKNTDNSEESVLYDRKYGKLKRKKRKSKRISSLRRPENTPHDLSSLKPSRFKNYSASNTPSLTYIPPVEMYETPFEVVLRKKKKKVIEDFSKGTIVFHSRNMHSNTLELETNEKEKIVSGISSVIRTNTTHENNNSSHEKSANKELQKKYNYNKYFNEKNPMNLNARIDKFTEVNSYKGNVNTDNKNNSAPPAFKNVKRVMQKLTLNDMRRKLALLKFPIVVTGQDQCASVKIQDYEAPQFSPMPSTWKYMSGWSTDYEKDNSKPNKYLKLLQRQKYASKNKKIDWRTKKYGHRVPVEEKNKILRPGGRRINYLTNKRSEESNARKQNAYFEDRDLKVLFHSQQDDFFYNKDVKNSSMMKSEQICLTRIDQKENYTDGKTMKNNENKKLLTYNNNKIINNPVTKYINVSRSKTEVQYKIYNTLKKLESNYFYDYSNWIEHFTQKSRKYPVKIKKNTMQLKSKYISKVSPKESGEQLSTPSVCKSRKKDGSWVNNNEIIRKPEHYITSSRDELQLEERDIMENSKIQKTVPSLYITRNNYMQGQSAIAKASRVKRMTKLVNIYAPPSKTETKSAKPRMKIVPKHNNDALSEASSDVQTAVQETTNYIPNQSENKIKTITIVPGFKKNANKVTINFLEENEIVLEDSLKHILITFEIIKSSQEKCDHLYVLPQCFKDKFSVRVLNSGRNQHYKAKYKLGIMRLPEQVCSLWPLFLKKLESGMFNITPESPKITTSETEINNILEINKITRGTLRNNHLKKTLRKPKLPTMSQDLDQYLSEINGMLINMKVLSFLQNYALTESFSHPLNVKMYKPEDETLKNTTLTINFDLLTKCYFQDFKQYYISDAFSYLEIKICFGETEKNSLLRLHQENLPILSFAIPIKVIQNIITFLTVLEEKSVAISEITKETRKLRTVRKTASASKIKNDIPVKVKNTCRNKSMSNIGEVHLRKSKQGKKKFRQESCNKTEIFDVNQVNDIKDFMKIIGCGGGDVSTNIINGQLAERILEDVSEFTIWSEYMSPGQALLVMLLSSKPETNSLVKFRSALVHGIATKRIVSSTELDQECLAVEQDADLDCQDDDKEILDELYSIAKKAASQQNLPFNEISKRTIESLLNRKRKLNLSYLRVMAKYVGLGLYSDK